VRKQPATERIKAGSTAGGMLAAAQSAEVSFIAATKNNLCTGQRVWGKLSVKPGYLP